MANLSAVSLLAALKESPENEALRTLVLNACLEQADADSLAEALRVCGAGLLAGSTERASAIHLLSVKGFDDEVLEVADAGSGHALLARARKLMQEGLRTEAATAYQQAIAINSAIEDSSLATLLSGKVVSLSAARPRVAAGVSNDDTDTFDAMRLVQPPSTHVDFSDVGGLDSVKQEIRRRIITPFLKPSLFQRFKRNAGGGILMYGPPGCGKTLLARATAGECGAKFYNVSVTDVLDMYIGESERKLHAIFEQARRAAPAVVFFDEMEAIGGKRQHSREATSAKLVSQFLTELDGFAQNNEGVLILAATNVPWAVDPAFRRPGRFDRVLFVPPPDAVARRTILQLVLNGRPLATDIDINEIAKRSSGFSGADLRNLIDTGVDEAIEESIEQGTEMPLSMRHVMTALDQTRPTTLEWLTTARNHARYANQGGQYDAVLDFLKEH